MTIKQQILKLWKLQGIVFDGNKKINLNSNLYYYKKVIKNCILKYKKFMIDLKLDSLNKDFK